MGVGFENRGYVRTYISQSVSQSLYYFVSDMKDGIVRKMEKKRVMVVVVVVDYSKPPGQIVS